MLTQDRLTRNQSPEQRFAKAVDELIQDGALRAENRQPLLTAIRDLESRFRTELLLKFELGLKAIRSANLIPEQYQSCALSLVQRLFDVTGDPENLLSPFINVVNELTRRGSRGSPLVWETAKGARKIAMNGSQKIIMEEYPFWPNEVVRVNGALQQDSAGKLTFRTYTYRQDDSDVFLLAPVRVDPAIIGRPITLHLRIVRPIPSTDHDHVQHGIDTYQAALTAVVRRPIVNPPDLSDLEGSVVSIEGQISRIEERNSRFVITVATPSGSYQVSSDGPALVGNVLGNLSRKNVEIGDFVAIPTRVGRDSLTHLSGEGILLITPSSDRAARNSATRSQVSADIQALRRALVDANYPAARNAFAAARSRELFTGELNEVKALHAQFPEEERPVAVSDFQPNYPPSDSVRRINDKFNVSIESLTVREFVEFAERNILSKQPANGVSVRELFSLMLQLDLPGDVIEIVATRTLKERLPRIRGMTVRDNPSLLAPEKNAVDSSIWALGFCRTRTSVLTLVTILEELVAKGEFYGTGDKASPARSGRAQPESFVAEIALALDVATDDLASRGAIVECRSRLSNVLQQLQSANADEPQAMRFLGELLNRQRR